ncbi:MAG: type 2 lantipeptide synthetase LanM [Candidatus Riflebacteria bacterium]|nr:type 2 lantipeptide synthetase LanM [Candidatus Riflebacteria bacterium]
MKNEDFTENIVIKALNIEERVRYRSIFGEDCGSTEQFLLSWKEMATDNNDELFRLRLEALSLSYEEALQVFGKQIKPLCFDQIDWAVYLFGVLQNFSDRSTSDPVHATQPVQPNQFHGADQCDKWINSWLAPWLRYAKCVLNARLDIDCKIISEEISGTMMEWLGKRLKEISRSVLVSRRNAFSATRSFSFFAELEEYKNLSDKAFSEWLENEGFINILREYPVLGKLSAILSLQCLNHFEELLKRFINDRTEIFSVFFNGKDQGKLSGARFGLSDQHFEGRTVVKLDFSSGNSIIYKPRDLNADRAWNELIRAFETHLGKECFVKTKILTKNYYGWMEFVKHQEPATENEMKDFYFQCGALAALFTALGATDIIQDNIIPTPEGPVPVDLETLISCPPQPFSEALSSPLARDSVVSTNFPPHWKFPDEKNFFKTGGMDFSEATSSRFFHDISKGFDATINYISTLNEKDCLEKLFSNSAFRLIIRDTELYDRMINYSLKPEFLSCGLKRSVFLERLYKLSNTTEVFRSLVSRTGYEIMCLERLDIPYFQVKSNGLDLFGANPSEKPLIKNIFPRLPVDEAKMTLRRLLDQKTIDVEKRILFDSCVFQNASPIKTNEAELNIDTKDQKGIENLIKNFHENDLKKTFLKVALKIGEDIICDSIPDRYGGITWIESKIRIIESEERAYFCPMDLYLMNGQSGMGLFLFALGKADSKFIDFGNKAFKAIERFLDNPLIPLSAPIGMAEGLGSLVLALTSAYRLSGDSRFLVQAERFAEFITPQRINSAKSPDVFHGTAGAAFSFLASSKLLNSNSGFLKKVEICCERLLENLIQTDGKHLAWSNTEGKFISGFAHGNAGISGVLGIAGLHLGRQDFIDAAISGFSFENSLWASDSENWLINGSTTDKPEFRSFFCHGASGIGFSRLMALDLSEQYQKDLSAAVKVVLNYPANYDHLCCGQCGQISFLYETAQKLKNKELENAAFQKTIEMINRYEKTGRFRFPDDKYSSFQAKGVYRGLSGIGLLLLRISDNLSIPLPWVLS